MKLPSLFIDQKFWERVIIASFLSRTFVLKFSARVN